ncbi:glycosyltransferase family 2 protein [Methylomicrobium lacus]|uniref:glycosyltransferase family 2 protein n=1 Tax=Methylomicrobium lacus TaxID=136992 RepID=UPI00045E6C5F|nr:glycosyltransferase family 2 protein [Methylomicrobium lacus]
MSDISVIILTYNEELHIERCINNMLLIAKEVFVVDSYSTDRTVEIAQSLGAKVYQNTFVNQALQFQWALDNCPVKTDWVMRMDADEYLESLLVEEIIRKVPELPNNINGIYFKYKLHFLGRWIKHGDRYPLILLRLWKNGQAHIENRWMDEHIVLDAGKSIIFDGHFVDANLNTIEWFIAKHNRYASREMIEILNQKYHLFHRNGSVAESETSQRKIKRLVKERLYNKLPLFARPIFYFCYRYFLRLGFLDGKEGFAYHFMQGLWYRCLVDLKCLEAERSLRGAETRAEKIARLVKLTGLMLE